MPCECVIAGWCQRHECDKSQHWFDLCRTRSDYFRLWENGQGPGQTVEQAIQTEVQDAETERVVCRNPAIASVIIAARNNAPFLGESIESALGQSVPCEVIYVDDASTDNSVEIASTFESQGLLVLTSAVHRGVCACRNSGALVAHAPNFVFLDGDDVLPRQFVEFHLREMAPQVPFVYGPALAFGDGPAAGTFWNVPKWEDYDIWRQNTVNTSAMYARWAFEAAGGWRDGAGSMWDWDLAIRASRFGTPRPSTAVLRYRQHAESWSSSLNERGAGRTALMADVRRLNATVSIGAIVSGRLPDFFPRWISAIAQAVRWIGSPRKPEFVVIDNSRNPELRQLMRSECNRYVGAFETIRILPFDQTFEFTTEIERRNGVATLLADASNRLRRELHGDIHWIIEDDILVPQIAGRRLWEVLTDGDPPPNAVAGFYRNRHNPVTYVAGTWRRGTPSEYETVPGDDLVSVDVSGTGCLMLWRDRTPRTWRSHVNGIAAHDWAWCRELKRRGGIIVMPTDVRCGHARSSEEIIPG